MTPTTTIFRAPLFISLVLLFPAAGLAEEGSGSSPQRSLIVSVGQTHQTGMNFRTPMQNLGYTNVRIADDNNANSVALGYRQPINTNWSVDFQYLNQGETNPQLQAIVPLGKTNAQAAQEIAQLMPKRGEGVDTTVLYHHPLGNGWTIQVGGGAFTWQGEREATVGNIRHAIKTHGISPSTKLGLSYPLSKGVNAESSWQHFFMPDEAIDRVAIGLAIGF